MRAIPSVSQKATGDEEGTSGYSKVQGTTGEKVVTKRLDRNKKFKVEKQCAKHKGGLRDGINKPTQ